MDDLKLIYKIDVFFNDVNYDLMMIKLLYRFKSATSIRKWKWIDDSFEIYVRRKTGRKFRICSAHKVMDKLIFGGINHFIENAWNMSILDSLFDI